MIKALIEAPKSMKVRRNKISKTPRLPIEKSPALSLVFHKCQVLALVRDLVKSLDNANTFDEWSRVSLHSQKKTTKVKKTWILSCQRPVYFVATS